MSAYDRVTAVQYGVGPIGARLVQTALERGIQFSGAVDIDPDKVGQDLGAMAGFDRHLDVTVTDDPDSALATGPDVVFHATGSSLEDIFSQLERIMAAGVNVVSTAEELSYPWRSQPERSRRLDELARQHDVRCLGTGINPGFAMDVLPAVLTTPCRRVDSIRARRVQDAAQRRLPLQKKVGAGRSPETFERTTAVGGGHVGLRESVHMLGDALGWELDEIEETMEPVVAKERISTRHFTVEPGQVLGIHQRALAERDGDTVLELDLKMFLRAEPVDRVLIGGQPDLEIEVKGGFHGDVATPAVLVNTVPRLLEGPPGLRTMLDLTLPSYRE